MTIVPRGIRNNNPGNIRSSSVKWASQIGDDELGFCIFKSPVYGIRAIAKLLKRYEVSYGLHTVSKMISRWAPATENETEAYIKHVAEIVGVDKDARISVIGFDNEDILKGLIEGIIKHENGQQPYTNDIIEMGIKLA